jgi:hypothetical protein
MPGFSTFMTCGILADDYVLVIVTLVIVTLIIVALIIVTMC